MNELGIFLSCPMVRHDCLGKDIDELRGKEVRRAVATDVLNHGIKPKAGRVAMNRQIIAKYSLKPDATKDRIRAGLGEIAVLSAVYLKHSLLQALKLHR